MLSYYVSLHMERALCPMLFKGDDHGATEAARTSPVAQAQRSASARKKMATKTTRDRLPVRSFNSLLADLRTVDANRITPR